MVKNIDWEKNDGIESGEDYFSGSSYDSEDFEARIVGAERHF